MQSALIKQDICFIEIYRVKRCFKPFQSSVAFHVETSHLIRTLIEMTGFRMECNAGLKWVKLAVKHCYSVL